TSLRLARDLLGRVLVRDLGGTRLAGRIVEVEAYRPDDPASRVPPRSRTSTRPSRSRARRSDVRSKNARGSASRSSLSVVLSRGTA
ncbi:MAG TPA: DNA-3-methyladenine glycosylase, partial [Actinomycetota bacterium]|nr:DNA-3-methyladenine glycosylase [Actinomycetota bacterium]